MKLNELAVANPTKQAAKVFESHFGRGINFDAVTPRQARGMLQRVRGLIAEHRRTPEFHNSEQNPNYLKLVVMEQALSIRAMEQEAPATGSASPQQTAAMQALQRQQQQRNIDDQIKQLDQEARDIATKKAQLQKQKSQPAMETRLQRRLQEASEVQQAQVVLASQDMVDQVQKMSEQVSAMQFKDLPALVDSIKNEVGVQQSAQFNTDATAALTGLLQNLQAAKQQLETALGVVTGESPAMQIPGTEPGMEQPAMPELPAELPAPEDDEEEVEIGAELGRERR